MHVRKGVPIGAILPDWVGRMPQGTETFIAATYGQQHYLNFFIVEQINASLADSKVACCGLDISDKITQ